jgi:hypothetical protein
MGPSSSTATGNQLYTPSSTSSARDVRLGVVSLPEQILDYKPKITPLYVDASVPAFFTHLFKKLKNL